MRTIFAAVILTLIFAAFCAPLGAQSTQPINLFLLESRGTNSGTIHAFNVNSSTGAFTEVNGSPFNGGLIPQQLLVDPTGRFVYVFNQQSQDITGLSVDPTSGALTDLPGSPFLIAATPVTAGIDPTGRFLYVFASVFTLNADYEYLYEYTIDSVTGVLTPASSAPAIWEFGLGYSIVSIAFDPAGNFAYLGQVAAGNVGAQTLICSIDFSTGALAEIGAVQPATTGQANDIAISPTAGFLYSVNSPFNLADAFAINPANGSLSEVSGSPFPVPNNPSSLVVHPSGNFLYVVNENQPYQTNYLPSQYNGSISGFAVNQGTGAMAQLAGSPFPAGINPSSIVVDPTGRFAYVTATKYTGGYTAFAQILGFSINASSGNLTPLPGSPWTDPVTSDGAQLAISYGPPASPNPAPAISALSPASVIANAVPFNLQVYGSNFVPGATAYIGGQARTTAFLNSSELNVGIFGSDISNSGTAVVFVFNPLPGGGASTSVELPVSASIPVISQLSPASVTAGAPSFDLFAIGSNFVTSSVINFNGAPVATFYSSPTAVFTQISPAQIEAPGTATISVTDPPNGVAGGGISGTALLTVVPPVPPFALTGISPTSTTAGGPAFLLTLNGSGFVQASQVTFNLNNVPTTFVNSSQLTAVIPASAIAIAGNPYVSVVNPGGATSAILNFVINPAVGSVTPPSVPAGSGALTLNVTGVGFTQSSIVLVNGKQRATAYQNSTLLLGTLTLADLSKSGTLVITVSNPPSSGSPAGVSFVVTDFSISATSGTQTTSAGRSANYGLMLSALNNTLSNSVTFSATGLPPLANPSFQPSSAPAGSPSMSLMFSVNTTAHSQSSTGVFPGHAGWPRAPLFFSLVLAAGTMWLAVAVRRMPKRRLAPNLLLASLIVLAAGLTACGATGSAPTPQIDPGSGTPEGNYTITVNASSGSATITTTVNLTVK